MRGTGVKKLRRQLFEAWPFLKQKHGKELRPFKSVFKILKENYMKGKVPC